MARSRGECSAAACATSQRASASTRSRGPQSPTTPSSPSGSRDRRRRHRRVPGGELLDLAPQRLAAAGVEPHVEERGLLGAADPELEEVRVGRAALPERRLEPARAPEQLAARPAPTRAAARSSSRRSRSSSSRSAPSRSRYSARVPSRSPSGRCAGPRCTSRAPSPARAAEKRSIVGKLREEVEPDPERERNERRAEREPRAVRVAGRRRETASSPAPSGRWTRGGRLNGTRPVPSAGASGGSTSRRRRRQQRAARLDELAGLERALLARRRARRPRRASRCASPRPRRWPRRRRRS